MSVEAATTFSELNSSWPLQSDGLIEGDDHIRLLKVVLSSQFPGAGGDGLAEVITASEDELNSLVGVTSNIQDQLDEITENDNLIAPSGTVIPFFQATVPTGWTQVLTQDNAMLRVVDGAGGGAGGSDSPISFSVSHNHSTSGHALTASEMPSHTHSYTDSTASATSASSNSGSSSGYAKNLTNSSPSKTTGSSGSGNSHSHGDTGTYSSTFTPKYINMILGRKD